MKSYEMASQVVILASEKERKNMTRLSISPTHKHRTEQKTECPAWALVSFDILLSGCECPLLLSFIRPPSLPPAQRFPKLLIWSRALCSLHNRHTYNIIDKSVVVKNKLSMDPTHASLMPLTHTILGYFEANKRFKWIGLQNKCIFCFTMQNDVIVK